MKYCLCHRGGGKSTQSSRRILKKSEYRWEVYRVTNYFISECITVALFWSRRPNSVKVRYTILFSVSVAYSWLLIVCTIRQGNYRHVITSATCKMMKCSLCPWFDQRFSFLALAMLNLRNVNTGGHITVLGFKMRFSAATPVFFSSLHLCTFPTTRI